MEDRATIIPVYSPLDGVVDGQWTYSPNDGGPDARWSRDCKPGCWNGGWGYPDSHRKRLSPLWNVKEVEKTAEIKDNFGFERFKVYLYDSEETVVLSSDEDTVELPEDVSEAPQTESQAESKRVGWRVTVTALLPNEKWEPIFDSELFIKLDDASRCYFENVKEYSLIAKVETKHYQDIKIYAEKIGYHRVEECCANCRWCHKKMTGQPQEMLVRNDKFMRDPKMIHQRLVCLNYKLFAKRLTDIERPDFDQLRVQPEVDPGCVCNHFEKRLPPHDPRFPNHCYDQYGEELPPRPPRTA